MIIFSQRHWLSPPKPSPMHKPRKSFGKNNLVGSWVYREGYPSRVSICTLAWWVLLAVD